MAEVKLKEETELWDPPNTKHSLELPHIKEEPKEEPLQEFPFTPVSVKTEDDEDKSSVLHQRPTEENREETNGAEAGCSTDPLTHLHSKGHSSDHTDHSEDWSPDKSSSKRSYAMINHDSSEKDAGENSKTHKCSRCGKSFLSKQDLKRHTLTHTRERPFRCSICIKGFWKERDFLVHIKTHTGEKPFSCSVCKNEFYRMYSLKLHMSVHTGENPFTCSVCQKCFMLKSHLNKHMRIHTGEKPFSCSVCQKAFTQKSYLNKHMKTHTRAGVLSPEQKVSEREGAETAGVAC